MKLLSLKQTSCRQTDTVFGASAIGSAIVTILSLGCICVGVYLLIYGRIGSFGAPRVFIAFEMLFALLFFWLASGSWRAATHPSNWLLRIQGNDLLIKFRSYQNWRLSEDDPQVILLHKDEIAFVRKASQKQLTQSMSAENSGGVEVQNQTELEIGLKSADTAGLATALAEERARPGWGEPRNQTKMLDYPVELAGDTLIRIRWTSVHPGIKRALAELGKLTTVAESQKTIEDFTPTALKNLPEAEQRARLAELAGRNRIEAIETAKRLYRFSTADAMRLIDELTKAPAQN